MKATNLPRKECVY